ncbi:MAG TPA: Efem/EfeO family lipoprotein, partial [Bradyrhizobium sp.]|nr:Efem/EfeO family lipoprotein [Bradyrhizobium sp.]
AALNTVDGKLDEMVTNRIEQLQAIVATPDLPHVNIADLRRTSEELVVALQSAAAKLGLQRPTLEAQAR